MSLSYETALKLKEAGFPLKRGIRETWSGDQSIFFGEEYINGHKVHYIFPTLEELIQECGERFLFLDRQRNHPTYFPIGWRAQEVGTDNGIAEGNGSTPEEAVANLYIALNKK